jgi:hypothetical protein
MNAATVSRVLAKTYNRSKTESTRVRGYSTTSAGFIVRQLQNGVAVSYNTGSWNSKSDINEINTRKAEMISSIRQTLINNGFELLEDSNSVVVIAKASK